MADTTPEGPEKVRVRLTIRPDEQIEVHPSEVPVLRAQGLLAEDEQDRPGAKPAGDKPGTKPADRAPGAKDGA
jgi:hypothetical protein